jgi:hypothetical protein
MPQTTESEAARSDVRRYVGAVLWSAFLVACLATMLFFACFDPLVLLHDASLPSWLSDRRGGYALGFFFFWAMTTLAAALATWLIASDARGAQRE